MFISERAYKMLASGGKTKRKSKQPKQPKQTEKEIQDQIRETLRCSGWYVIRHQQGIGSLKGLSDLTAIKGGRTVYIEVKTPRGVQSEYQEEFQSQIEAHGGIYILARSVDDISFLCKK